MKAHYCLPIATDSAAGVITRLETHRKNYDYFEVWLDYIEDLSPEIFSKLFALVDETKLIFLFRRKNLEPIHMPFKQRTEILTALSPAKAYIDLDVVTQEDEVKFLTELRPAPPSIISYHNYERTPSETELQTVIDRVLAKKPTICKVATQCQNERDALRLLTLLLQLKERGQRSIVLGMGAHGKVTRIFGSLWGNEMIFAPADGTDHTAPGQLTKANLEKILKELGEN